MNRMNEHVWHGQEFTRYKKHITILTYPRAHLLAHRRVLTRRRAGTGAVWRR